MPNNRIFFRKLEGCASKVYSMSGQKQKSERKSEGIPGNHQCRCTQPDSGHSEERKNGQRQRSTPEEEARVCSVQYHYTEQVSITFVILRQKNFCI